MVAIKEAWPSRAGDHIPELTPEDVCIGRTGRVVEIINGDRALSSSGETARLQRMFDGSARTMHGYEAILNALKMQS